MKINQKIVLYKRDPNTKVWSSTPTQIPNARDISVSVGLGKKKDRWSCKISNLNWNKYFNSESKIDVEDQVKIYLWTGDRNETTSDIKMNGVVRRINYDKDKGIITINGENFVESILKVQSWIDSEGVSLTVPQIIQWIIRNVNAVLEESSAPGQPRYLYGGEASEWSSICGNPTTKNDGSAFPSYEVFEKYTDAYELIEKYSSNEYTGDGSYMWWVEYDSANDRWLFKWRYKGTDTSGTLTEQSGWNITVDKDPDEILNWLIVNAGEDLYGNPIEFLNTNIDSASSYSPEMRYYSKTSDLFSVWHGNERDAGGIDDNGFPTSFPRTMQFKEIDTSTWTEKSNFWVVNSNKEFNTALRTKAEFEARKITNDILRLYEKPRPKVTMDVPPNSSYTLGNVYVIDLPSFNFSNSKMRLMQIDYTPWSQRLYFEQDEKILLES